MKIERLTLYLISYGKDSFDPKRFVPIKNRPGWTKPDGGLWASPVGANFGWREWCIGEEFHLEQLEKHFKFLYTGNVITINNYEDMLELPRNIVWPDLPKLTSIDFEKLLADGVDAIYLTEKGEEKTRHTFPNMYGWDCESVLIMNPDGIEKEKPVWKKTASKASRVAT